MKFCNSGLLFVMCLIIMLVDSTVGLVDCTLPDGSQVVVRAITDRIIHIRCEQNGMMAKKSLIVPDIQRAKAKVQISQKGDVTILKTGVLETRLNRSTGNVSFYDSSGQRLLAEAGRTIEPYAFKKHTLFRTQQRWLADETQAYYGLGQYEHSTMDYQGQTVRIKQDNKDAVSTFVVSSGGYGILWDVNCTASFSAAVKNEISFNAEATLNFDYYFVYGPDYDNIIKGYRELTGTAPMFPRWAYGYMQSKERYVTQQEVLDTARKFRQLGFPIDLIIQDWRYWGDDNSFWSGMVWDPDRYPNPDGLIAQLHDDLNMKLMAVIWPFVGDNTDLARELEKNGGFLKGRSRLSNGQLYDAYDDESRDIYWKYANEGLFQRGLDAWWMDGSEPEDVQLYSGDTGYGPIESCHNAYSLVHTEGIYKRQRQTSEDKRVFILTRSAYAGQQRTGAATWSGDIHADWNVFEKQIGAGINFCMSGLPYWTTDIGAFFTGNYLPQGKDHPGYRELYTRWFQFGTFCPLFRSHGTHIPREPWQFGDKTYAILKKYADLRYRLMPYIYTLASEVTREHGTIMRGLPMDFPTDKNCLHNGRQFMFGPALLVCPVTRGTVEMSSETIPSDHLMTPDGTKGGLAAEYFTGTDLKHSVKVSMDKEISFNWSIESPKGLPRENYSARWQGQLFIDEGGQYEIGVIADDGVRLWVDDELIVDQWVVQPATQYFKKLQFRDNTCHTIKLEYYQAQGDAVLKLLWRKPLVQKAKGPQKTDVYLPECEGWYDFWTGEFLQAGLSIAKETPIDIMPLYVRAGSILPLGPTMQYTTEKPADPIELRIYPGKDASFTLYEDEDDNYNYENGNYSLIRFDWDDTKKTLTIGKRQGRFKGMLGNRTFHIVLVCPGQGVGPAATDEPDDTVQYHGEKVSVQLNQ